VTDAVQTVGARNLSQQDIEDLITTVLQQVVADQNDALWLLIAQIDHVNAQKTELHDYLDELQVRQADLQQRCPGDNCDALLLEEINTEVGGLMDKLDGLGDVTMEKQQRLQMYMDAFAQTAAMVTNVLAKMSDTAQRIVENLK
jgi:uncharacterized protein YukE